MRFELKSATYNDEFSFGYAMELKYKGFDVKHLKTRSVQGGDINMFIVDVQSLEQLSDLIKEVGKDIVITSDCEPYCFAELYPDFDFPKYRILVYDDYIE